MISGCSRNKPQLHWLRSRRQWPTAAEGHCRHLMLLSCWHHLDMCTADDDPSLPFAQSAFSAASLDCTGGFVPQPGYPGGASRCMMPSDSNSYGATHAMELLTCDAGDLQDLLGQSTTLAPAAGSALCQYVQLGRLLSLHRLSFQGNSARAMPALAVAHCCSTAWCGDLLQHLGSIPVLFLNPALSPIADHLGLNGLP